MENNKKHHLWIPDEEVQRVSKIPTARPKPRNVSHEDHGDKLSDSLVAIKTAQDKVDKDNSLIDTDLMVFKVELPEEEKIKDKKEIFDSTGMKIRAVKNSSSAIVTSTRAQFEMLRKRVTAYRNEGTEKGRFDYIDKFEPFIGSIKNSSELTKTMAKDQKPSTLDVQLMLIPNLDNAHYASTLPKLINKIHEINGSIQQEPYTLSDNTPVIRVIIPSSSLSRFENDPAIYRIEETDFFNVDPSSLSSIKIEGLKIADGVEIDELPFVAVLDSGIAFPEELSKLVLQHWTPSGSLGGNSVHGTKVASRVVFRYLDEPRSHNGLVPRARVIDCNVLDGNVPANILIKRIQEAVKEFSEIAKIFNLSANANSPIEGDEMSIVGYEIDVLQRSYQVQFVLSAGNHDLWKIESSLDDIIDDDDTQVAAPSDSILGISVGSIIGFDHKFSLSKTNEIAPYSRRGPGFRGYSKPDLTAFAGTVTFISGLTGVPEDSFSLLLASDGSLIPDAGTSFSAPVVAGDLAEVLNILPHEDVLLAKALLFHNAVPLWDTEDLDDTELMFLHNLYGRGLSNVEASIYSSTDKVTFLRTGTLNKTTKERISIYMPEILAAQVGRNVARVSVTCMSLPPIDRTKGTEYLGAYIRASLKKSGLDGTSLLAVKPEFKEGRQKWDVCQQFTKIFSRFNAGDWQIWLELFSRWDEEHLDVPYALVVTIEDISKELDIYSEIEVQNRFRPINTLRVRVTNQN